MLWSWVETSAQLFFWCQAAAVTVSALSSTQALVATSDTIALSTSTGHGDWTLTSGGGTFAAGSSNSGSASYTYATTDGGVAVFALRDTYAETVTINVVDGSSSATSGSALASGDLPLTFVASRISDSPISATIPPRALPGRH